MQKFKLNKQIKNLVKDLGLDIRYATTPRKAKIMGLKIPKDIIAAYVGEGVIFVRTPMAMDNDYMNIVILHEIGHAILHGFKIQPKRFLEENMANAISLAFAASMGLPVSTEILSEYASFSKQDSGKKKK